MPKPQTNSTAIAGSSPVPCSPSFDPKVDNECTLQRHKDGRLDMKEFLSQPLYGINTYGAEDFDSRDTNKDGYVTFEEQMQK